MIDPKEIERLVELTKRAELGELETRIDLRDALERWFRANSAALLELEQDARERPSWDKIIADLRSVLDDAKLRGGES